jgi:S1-C subfamily serine protease
LEIFTAISDGPVHNASDLRNKIGLLRIGDELELTVLRDERPTIIRATVAAREQGSR